AKRPGRLSEQRNSWEVYVGHDVHAGPKLTIPVLARLENDFYRNPLHNFHVVAGGVLRREQTEERACRARNAVHVALHSFAVRIHLDSRSLSNAHFPEL